MRFNPKARLDRSRVRDSGRGGGGGGGGLPGGGQMRLPIPGGAKAGGGLGGVIIIILFLVLTQCTGGGTDPTGGGLSSSRFNGPDSGRYDSCQTGADANSNPDCALVAVENSLTDYWSKALPDQSNQPFRPEQGIQTFSGGVSTGCGQASSQMGPFYCPTDKTIYLDPTFYRDILQGQLGGKDAPFVRAYVTAHEYGHHIQNLLGTMGKVRTQQGPNSDSVRLELQADCYAGMWTKNATQTQDADGNVLIEGLTDQDIKDAIGAATAVGDDRIQKETSGRVSPEQWTHGSAEARVRWFMTGYQEGTLKACDTFSVAKVE